MNMMHLKRKSEQAINSYKTNEHNSSLEKNDAKYCRSEGIFSPYPGLCMEKFAEKTQNKEACSTISKSRYKTVCLERFN